jgi:hypothetical protein
VRVARQQPHQFFTGVAAGPDDGDGLCFHDSG